MAEDFAGSDILEGVEAGPKTGEDGALHHIVPEESLFGEKVAQNCFGSPSASSVP